MAFTRPKLALPCISLDGVFGNGVCAYAIGKYMLSPNKHKTRNGLKRLRQSMPMPIWIIDFID
jgi:hypothetical protein